MERGGPRAAEQAPATKRPPSPSQQQGIKSFFKAKEPSASPPAPVATTGQTRQPGPDAEVLCFSGAGSGGQPPTSPMSIGGDSEENDKLDGDEELPVIEPRHLPCAGFIPDLGFPPASSYPFGIHNSEVGKTFAWKVELGAGEVRLRAVSEDGRPACTGKSSSAGEPCAPCAALEFYPKLQGEFVRLELYPRRRGLL